MPANQQGEFSVSALSDKIAKASEPPTNRPKNFISWFSGLPEKDKEITWNALINENLKTYTLHKIFREEGMGVSKDTFVAFRRNVLLGKVARTDIDE